MGYIREVHGYNYHRRRCYPRRMVNSDRNAMIFSSSDSPKPSAILSGEGLDEGNKESRCNRTDSCHLWFAANESMHLPGSLVYILPDLATPLNHSHGKNR
jgi:hypothetical protein